MSNWESSLRRSDWTRKIGLESDGIERLSWVLVVVVSTLQDIPVAEVGTSTQ